MVFTASEMRKAARPAKDNSTRFFTAALKGDVTTLNAMIAAGQSVDVRDNSGKTALMRAAEGGHMEAAKVLIAAGADVSASVSDEDSIRYGCNPVIFAAESGNAELVELLVDAGASAKCKAADGSSPLSFAVQHRCAHMVDVLLKAGMPLPKDILVLSLWSGAKEVTLMLIAAGANMNACDDLGQSLVHRAAEKGEIEILRALLRAKPKLNAKFNGSTPLLIAIERGKADCALELIRAGADISQADSFGYNALMRAGMLGRNKVVSALLKAGADPNAKDKTGKTALMLANEKEQNEVVELLRVSGCDESGYKIQECIRAALKGDVERIRQLINEGVDVNATYQSGARALASAAKHGHTEVVRLLLKSGADPSTKVGASVWGMAIAADALAIAANEGHLEIVRLLIEAGADVNGSEMIGKSVLEVAAMDGHADVVRELLKAGFPISGKAAIEALTAAIRNKREAAAIMLVEASVKPKGQEAANLLVTAAEKGMARLVQALLQAGVDPKGRDKYDETALQAAQAKGHAKIMAMLEKARSPQASPGMELIEAAERGDLRTVHRLILEGVDLESRDAKGATALIRASANCHLAVMNALLAAGANPNASTHFAKRDKKKWFSHMDLTSETPLSCAVAAQFLPAVELLLGAGADIRKTECGHLACMILQEGTKSGAALVERLLDAGMDANALWPGPNASALEIAVQEGFTNLVEKLIRAGARLKTSWERDRAVLDAIERKDANIVRMLLEEGIAPMKGRITPEALVYAAEAGLDDIVRLLLKHGAKIDARIDASFNSRRPADRVAALMGAACGGHESTVKILLEAGANPNAEDAIGCTAFDWAQENKDESVQRRICRLLQAAMADTRGSKTRRL